MAGVWVETYKDYQSHGEAKEGGDTKYVQRVDPKPSGSLSADLILLYLLCSIRFPLSSKSKPLATLCGSENENLCILHLLHRVRSSHHRNRPTRCMHLLCSVDSLALEKQKESKWPVL